MPSKGVVRIDDSSGIARIEFSHPKANSLPASLLDQLIEAFAQVSANPKVKAVLLGSEGKTFCAGASFDEFNQLSSVQEAEKFFARFAKLFLAMKQCPKWVLGRVQGKAVGGGVGLVAALDYAIASTDFFACLSEYALDIGPYVIGPVIERRIGPAAFASMALDCKWRDSHWCLERGLVDVVVDESDMLAQHCDELLSTLSTRCPKATETLKKVAWEQSADLGELMNRRAKTSAELLMAKKSRENV